MISAFGNIPDNIRKEKYLQDIPVFIGYSVVKTLHSDTLGLSDLHQHSFIEISYVEKGCGFHRIWNESFPVSPGDLFVLNVAVPHGFFSMSEENSLLVRSLFFDPKDLYGEEITKIDSEKYLFGLFARNNFTIYLPLKSRQLKHISARFDEIKLETNEKQIDWTDAVHSQLTLLLLQIKRLSYLFDAQKTNRETETTLIASSVLRLVQEHYADPAFSLRNIAEILHRSTASVSRTFHDATGKHFSEYLCFYRMQQASSLLVETELSNEDIASRCGYCDFPSFYKQFHKVIGTTPGEYRKQAKWEQQQNPMSAANNPLKYLLYAEIAERLQQCRKSDVAGLVSQALEKGFPPYEILYEGLVHGMNAVAQKYQSNEIYVMEVYGVASTMKESMELLKPHLNESGVHSIGRAVICTVKGDLHDIGKNLVKLMLSAEGIDCVDLGVDVSPSAVVEAVRTHSPQLVCLSALLTSTMMRQKDIITALAEAGLRDTVMVMVGGAPVTQEFADSIGADCYTPDAMTAAKEARRLILEQRERKRNSTEVSE